MTPSGLYRFGVGAVWMMTVIALSLVTEQGRSGVADDRLFAGVLSASLIVLSAIDARDHRLPDWLTLPLLLLGLLYGSQSGWRSFAFSALGAGAGYALIFGLAWYWRARRGEDGIGLGDAKLLAAGGAWCGLLGLPLILLLSSVGGLVFAAIMRFTSVAAGIDMQQRQIAFGPFLCAAIWLVFLFPLDTLAN